MASFKMVVMALIPMIFSVVSVADNYVATSETVFTNYSSCIAAKVVYEPSLSRPMTVGQKTTMASAGWQQGDCVLSPEVVKVVAGKRQVVTGWVFLPAQFQLSKVGDRFFMFACSNAIERIGPPTGSQPVRQVASDNDDFIEQLAREQIENETQPVAVSTAILGNMTATTTGGGGAIVQKSGMSTTGVVATVAVVGGLVYLASRDRGDKTTINNNGTCAGAVVGVQGNNNATCGGVVQQGNPTTQPLGCNAPNRTVNGICTAPPTCSGTAILDQQSFTCQCVAPNRVFSNGVCQVPRQCSAAEVLGVDNVCVARCSAPLVWNGSSCQATIQTQTCWDGSVIPVTQYCPVQTQYCPDGTVKPVGGTCPLVCTGGQVDRGGYCGCPANAPNNYSGQCNVCPQGQVLQGGFCQTITQQCPPGQEWDGFQCRCPNNGQSIGGQCQTAPICTIPGQTPVGATCQCPQGQQVINGSCQNLVQCTGGTVVGGQCTCLPGMSFDGFQCRIPNQ